MRSATFLVVASLFFAGVADAMPLATCFDQAAAKFGIEADLLITIAEVESGLRATALNKNENGSYDIGMMQVNSRWLPTLAQWGISESELYDPCVNIEVGAWVLARNIQRFGGTWEAVGAYNATTESKRQVYAWHVYKRFHEPISEDTLRLLAGFLPSQVASQCGTCPRAAGIIP